MEKTILVKMGELVVVRINGERNIILKTVLGSCVGVVLVDVQRRIGGLAHIMLPRQLKGDDAYGKYADTAVPLLLKKLLNSGAEREKIKAYVAGGACMFGNCDERGASKIGEENIKSTIKVLEVLSIPVVFKETGGNRGRTLMYNMKEDKVFIKVLSQFTGKKREGVLDK